MNVLKWCCRWVLWLYIVYRQLPHLDDKSKALVEIPWMIGLISVVYPPTAAIILHIRGESLHQMLMLALCVYLSFGLFLYFLLRELRARNVHWANNGAW